VGPTGLRVELGLLFDLRLAAARPQEFPDALALWGVCPRPASA